MKVSFNYSESQRFLARALKVIPLGSQTFSKSITQYPRDCSPLFIEKAKGAIVFDIDNNRYVDVVNALAAITIGYRNKKVDSGVKRQLRKGSIFSLPGTLEATVAEKISQLVPGAEMMRFTKNGSDATSAAIRIARSYTQRDHVVVSGYHGWHDWYIGITSRNKGVPDKISALTHKAIFNDIESFINLFNLFPRQIAAVVVEPLGASLPAPNFLFRLKELCKKEGAVLIFDETISGFRVSEGGAQELFGITPDLSTFGKGIANGYPLAVIAGKAELMKEMEEIFVSGTFGGDLISLAAANEVLDMHIRREVCKNLFVKGQSVKSKIESLLTQIGLSDVLSVSGHPSWLFWNWNIQADQLDVAKSMFLQNNIANGILMLNTINISVAYDSKADTMFFDGLTNTLRLLHDSYVKNDFSLHLKGQIIRPLFKIR